MAARSRFLPLVVLLKVGGGGSDAASKRRRRRMYRRPLPFVDKSRNDSMVTVAPPAGLAATRLVQGRRRAGAPGQVPGETTGRPRKCSRSCPCLACGRTRRPVRRRGSGHCRGQRPAAGRSVAVGHARGPGFDARGVKCLGVHEPSGGLRRGDGGRGLAETRCQVRHAVGDVDDDPRNAGRVSAGRTQVGDLVKGRDGVE